MLKNLHASLKMSDVSRLAGISDSTFYNTFKRIHGCSPNIFFIHARMHRAGLLLRTTNLRVKEVAAVMGYDDPFYFSRAFKLVHGLAPKAYRTQAGGRVIQD